MTPVRFSTSELPPSKRAMGWTEMVRRHINALDVELTRNAAFNGEFTSTRLGQNRFTRVQADFQRIRRVPLRGGAEHAVFDLVYVLDGHLDLTSPYLQDRVETGDWVFISNRERYEMQTSQSCTCFVMHLAEQWLKPHLAEAHRALEMQGRERNPWHDALACGLRALSQVQIDQITWSDSCAIEQIPQLLGLACRVAQSESSTHTGALMHLAMNVIRGNFHVEGLDAVAVAEEMGISRRYLYSIMASHGTSFGHELQRVRLEHAAKMLVSPAFKNKLVAEISFAVGLMDPAHFTKCFKAMYGLTPTAYRLSKTPGMLTES